MFRLAKWLPCVAVFAGAVMLGTASPARADIELNLTQTTGSGGSTGNLTSSGDSQSFSGTVGDFSVTISEGKSNSPGGVNALAQLANAFITNNGSKTETLQILVSANGFTSPSSPPPLIVLDTVSGSGVNGTLTGNAQGFASNSNTLGAEDFASTKLTFSTTGSSQSFSGNGRVDGYNASTPYSLTYVETITLSAGGSLTLTGGNVQTLVPEPASMMAAFTALPFLGLGAWLRRRKQTA